MKTLFIIFTVLLVLSVFTTTYLIIKLFKMEGRIEHYELELEDDTKIMEKVIERLKELKDSEQ